MPRQGHSMSPHESCHNHDHNIAISIIVSDHITSHHIIPYTTRQIISIPMILWIIPILMLILIITAPALGIGCMLVSCPTKTVCRCLAPHPLLPPRPSVHASFFRSRCPCSRPCLCPYFCPWLLSPSLVTYVDSAGKRRRGNRMLSGWNVAVAILVVVVVVVAVGWASPKWPMSMCSWQPSLLLTILYVPLSPILPHKSLPALPSPHSLPPTPSLSLLSLSPSCMLHSLATLSLLHRVLSLRTHSHHTATAHPLLSRQYKRRPIMTTDERCKEVDSCKAVYKAIPLPDDYRYDTTVLKYWYNDNLILCNIRLSARRGWRIRTWCYNTIWYWHDTIP